MGVGDGIMEEIDGTFEWKEKDMSEEPMEAEYEEESREVAVAQKRGEIVSISDSQLELARRTVAPGLGGDEFEVFKHACRHSGLDPLMKQIYGIKRKGKLTIQIGIDGGRLIADRTGKYAGSDDAIFGGSPKQPDFAATVTVYKMVSGVRCPFTATARWDEYCPDPGPSGNADVMWQKMPHTMLAKCAEMLALRKAFPADLSGLYIHEEMDQAGRDPISAESVTVRPAEQPQKRAQAAPKPVSHPEAAQGAPKPDPVPEMPMEGPSMPPGGPGEPITGAPEGVKVSGSDTPSNAVLGHVIEVYPPKTTKKDGSQLMTRKGEPYEIWDMKLQSVEPGKQPFAASMMSFKSARAYDTAVWAKRHDLPVVFACRPEERYGKFDLEYIAVDEAALDQAIIEQSTPTGPEPSEGDNPEAQDEIPRGE